jgi:hypothetical protein
MRPRSLLAALTVLALGYAAFAKAQVKTANTSAASPAHIMVGPDAITWQPVPRDWADGPPPPGFTLGQSEVAIIQGDPYRGGSAICDSDSVNRWHTTPSALAPNR